MKKILFSLFTALTFFALPAFADVPNEINYQGRLREYGQPITGNRTMSFKIYAISSGGVPVWSSGDVVVAVTTGTFSYAMSPTGVDWRWKDFWIETTVSGKILSPREKIAASVYALHSRTAEDISKTSGTVKVTIGNTSELAITTFTVSAEYNRVVNVSTPTAYDDGATKGYVDTAVSGGAGAGSFNTLAVSSTTSIGIAGVTTARLVVEPASGVSMDARAGRIINVSTPIAVLEAANKGYVDTWLPTGTILMWGGSQASIPSGWLLCDGSAISRTTFARLYAVIGIFHGSGDGTNTFNLPDLRNRFIVGAGQTYAVKDTGGSNTHTLTTAEMPSHTHTQDAHTHTQNAHNHGITDPGHRHTYTEAIDSGEWQPTGSWTTRPNVGDSSSFTNYVVTGITINNATATNQNTTATNQNTGGGAAHENRPPYFALCYIIKN